jgi:hypothetical protein
MVKLGTHKGLGHQVLALMLVAAGTPFLLLTAIQLSRIEKVTKYLPFKRVEGSSDSTKNRKVEKICHQNYYF